MRQAMHILVALLLGFPACLLFGAVTSCKSTVGGTPTQTQSCNIAVTSGNRVVMIAAGGIQTPTFTSTSPSLTWTQRASAQQNIGTAYLSLADSVATSTGTMTCQVDQGTTKTFWAMFCLELGTATGNIDASNTASGSGGSAGTPASVSITSSTSSGFLVFAGLFSSGTVYTPSGYTNHQNDTANSGGAAETKSPSTIGTETATVNNLPIDANYGIILINYLPASAASVRKMIIVVQ